MTRPATSLIRYAPFFRLAEVHRVLDYGAGLLRNSLYLAEQGFEVYAADVPDQVKVLSRHPEAGKLAGFLTIGELPQTRLGADLVVSTYVFNIIVTREGRKRYLDNVASNLKPGGYFLIEVNGRSDEESCMSTLHHYLGCHHEAKGYRHEDLDRWLSPHRLERVCHYYNNLALAAVYRLTV